MDAIFPIEVGEPSLKRQLGDLGLNEVQLIVELDTLLKRQELVIVRIEAHKRIVAKIDPQHME